MRVDGFARTVGLAVALGVGALSATSALAATLSFAGGTVSSLPADYDPLPGLSPSSVVTLTGSSNVRVFKAASDGGSVGGGLSLSAPSDMAFTFFGKEADATNFSVSNGVDLFSNLAVANTFALTRDDGGLVDFGFRTTGLPSIGGASITNGGTSSFANLKIAFSDVFNSGQSVLAFFGDGRGDADFDDLVMRIDAIGPDPILPPGPPSQVPLPAAGLMMLAALGAVGGMRLRRRR